MIRINEILTSRGVDLPLPSQSTTSPENRYERGLARAREIVGDAVDKMLENSLTGQKHIAEYLADNCFGDFYTRTGLDAKIRELLTFSMLLSLGGCEPQLKGHIVANVRVGNDKKTLVDVITQLLPYVGYPRTLNALACLNDTIRED